MPSATCVSAPPGSVRPFDQLFAQAYLAHDCDGTAAYRSLRPTCKYVTAASQASRLRKKPHVAEEIGRLIRARHGITREQIESDLLTARELALATGDPSVIGANAMDRAKLAGFLVEKREVRTLTDEQSTAIRDLVRRTFRTTTPSTVEKECPTPSDMLKVSTPTPSGASTPTASSSDAN